MKKVKDPWSSVTCPVHEIRRLYPTIFIGFNNVTKFDYWQPCCGASLYVL